MASEIIRLMNVVMAFPAIAEPESYGDGEPAYGAKFPIEPGSDAEKKIEAAMLAVAKEEWKDAGEAVLKGLIDKDKVALRKKTYTSTKTGQPYQGFEGKHYLSARNPKTAPTVVDQFGAEVEDKKAIERLAYSGAVVHASLEIWAQDNKWGRRVNCTLRGIMLTGKGENFGGGSAPATASEFADLAQNPEDFV